jgi:hypothetical protein
MVEKLSTVSMLVFLLQYKANMHFHKLFLDVPTEEPLRQSKSYFI